MAVSWAIDEKGVKRGAAAAGAGALVFLAGIPPILGYSRWGSFSFLGMDILDTYDWAVNSLFLPLGGLLTAVFTGYVWKARRAAAAGKLGAADSFGVRLWGFLIRYLIPLAIGLILATGLAGKLLGRSG